jgi:hypothetical protein
MLKSLFGHLWLAFLPTLGNACKIANICTHDHFASALCGSDCCHRPFSQSTCSEHQRSIQKYMQQLIWTENMSTAGCWERKWILTHTPLLSRSYLMLARRRMGPHAHTYTLVRIHAPHYVRQRLRATPGCTSRTFTLITTRGNVR